MSIVPNPSVLFILKKLITPFVIPPGCCVLLLFLLAAKLRCERRWRMFRLAGTLALIFWLLSVWPVARGLTQGLEKGLSLPPEPHGDVIVLLGGGLYADVPDLTGRGTPSDDMMTRLVMAVRLYRRLHLPVIVSGGSVYGKTTPEAVVDGRFLADLGIPQDQIIQETRSRDTRENALYCRKIIRQRGFRSPLLITSAYHMPRSIRAFQLAGVEVTPVPARFVTGSAMPVSWSDWLPSASALWQSSAALHEYFGLLFYRLGA